MLSIYSYPYLVDLLTGSHVKEFENGFYEAKFRLPDEIYRQIQPKLTSLQEQLSDSVPTSRWVSVTDVNELMFKCLQQFDLQNNNIIRQYIGNYNVDICYLFGTKYGSDHRNSQKWHHDSVGKRLKIFFVFEEDINPTLNVEKYSARARIFDPILSKDERSSYTPKHDITQIRFIPDTGYFVDTNFMHSGVKGDQGSTRIAFVCELSNRFKRFARGRVGPRSEA